LLTEVHYLLNFFLMKGLPNCRRQKEITEFDTGKT